MAGNDANNGLVLAFAAALVSGISVFVNGSAVKLSDPIVYTTMKNIGSFLFLAAMALAIREFDYIRRISVRQWGYLIGIGIIGGSVPFAMFFWGLSLGGAAISSFIYRSLFIFAGIFGYLILKEKPQWKDVAAGLVMLLGNALLVSGSLALSFGQILVFGATILWGLEYTLSRKILSEIRPSTLMLSRMFFGSLVLLALLSINGTVYSIFSMNLNVIAWLAITSLLLAVFVFTWYTSLKYLPVLKATAVLALGGIVTTVLNTFFLAQPLNLVSALGLLITVIGVVIMISVSDLLQAANKINLSKLMG